jgi:TPR repeat protein
LYENGFGESPKLKVSLEWYKKAAKLGSARRISYYVRGLLEGYSGKP